MRKDNAYLADMLDAAIRLHRPPTQRRMSNEAQVLHAEHSDRYQLTKFVIPSLSRNLAERLTGRIFPDSGLRTRDAGLAFVRLTPPLKNRTLNTIGRQHNTGVTTMTVYLGKRWQKKLAELPETGMGSQHVDIILKNGRVLPDLPVFNGEECQTVEAFDPTEIDDTALSKKILSGNLRESDTAGLTPGLSDGVTTVSVAHSECRVNSPGTTGQASCRAFCLPPIGSPSTGSSPARPAHSPR